MTTLDTAVFVLYDAPMTTDALQTLFKSTSTGATQTWHIEVEERSCDAVIITTYGQLGGKMQVTRDIITEGKNLGRANATTPQQQAQAEALAQWEKKLKNRGYVQTLDAAIAGAVDTDFVAGGVDPMLAQSYSKHASKIVWPAYTQPKCVAGATLLLTDRGWLAARYIKPGTQIMSASGVFRPVLEVHKNGSSRGQYMTTINPWCGMKVDLTADHKMLVRNGATNEWRGAQDIQVGDWLVLPKPQPSDIQTPFPLCLELGPGYEKTIQLTEDFLWFLGLWVGDGSAEGRGNGKTEGRISFGINRRDQDIVNRLLQVFKELKIPAHTHEFKSSEMTQVYGVDIMLTRWLGQNFRDVDNDGYARHGKPGKGNSSWNKTIPVWFDSLSDEEFAWFSEGWTDADSDKRGKGDGGGVKVATVSSFLSGMMYRQFLMRDVPVSMQTERTHYTYKGVRHESSAFIMRFLKDDRFLKSADDCWLLKVKSVEIRSGSVAVKSLYDFTIDSEHNYMASSIVHNCDGHRCIAIVKDGVATLWSRTRKPITGVPHIIKALENSGLDDMTLDGELYNHDYRDKFEELTSFIKRPVPKPGHEVVQFHVYDLVSDAPFSQRLDILHATFPAELNGAGPVVLVDTQLVSDEEAAMGAFTLFTDQGYEGSMLRNADSLYENKRSYGLQKVKAMLDDEWEIVGVEEGRGKMAGKAIFVCALSDGNTFRVKMKGTLDSLRQYVDDPTLALNRMLTVQYQGLTADGTPRFPVGLRIRTDL